jgi:lysophospholipid hydrolase
VALEDIGAPTAYLDQATVIRQLGKHAFTKMGKLKVSGWLGEKERKYKMVLYVVDTPVTSSWTMTSIKQVSRVGIWGCIDIYILKGSHISGGFCLACRHGR